MQRQYASWNRCWVKVMHACSGIRFSDCCTGRGSAGIYLQEVARLFAIHPRTLNRRLHAEGTTFNALLSEIRYNVARQLLRDTHLQTADIALILGYAESASFNHAFRRWSATTATAWRSSQPLSL
jgi:AraC-like DNA-binding protein